MRHGGHVTPTHAHFGKVSRTREIDTSECVGLAVLEWQRELVFQRGELIENLTRVISWFASFGCCSLFLLSEA